MDAREYHRLKAQENELQTRLTEVKRQLVNMEWQDFLKYYFIRTASPLQIPEEYDEERARDIV